MNPLGSVSLYYLSASLLLCLHRRLHDPQISQSTQATSNAALINDALNQQTLQGVALFSMPYVCLFTVLKVACFFSVSFSALSCTANVGGLLWQIFSLIQAMLMLNIKSCILTLRRGLILCASIIHIYVNVMSWFAVLRNLKEGWLWVLKRKNLSF